MSTSGSARPVTDAAATVVARVEGPALLDEHCADRSVLHVLAMFVVASDPTVTDIGLTAETEADRLGSLTYKLLVLLKSFATTAGEDLPDAEASKTERDTGMVMCIEAALSDFALRMAASRSFLVESSVAANSTVEVTGDAG